MLEPTSKEAALFTETDVALAQKFREAGFGLHKDGELLLSSLEAGYLAKISKSRFAAGTLTSFTTAQKKRDKIFPFALSVYFIIRQTGRMVAPFEKTSQYFRAYAPGVGRTENRPSQLVFLLPGKAPSSKQLVEQVKIAHLARLELIIACGTEEEPHFYKLSAFNF
jgi:tRNA splicing endonuclease